VCAFEEEIKIKNIFLLVINNFQIIIVFQRSKPASFCHCLLVVCRHVSLASAMKKFEDLHDAI